MAEKRNANAEENIQEPKEKTIYKNNALSSVHWYNVINNPHRIKAEHPFPSCFLRDEKKIYPLA